MAANRADLQAFLAQYGKDKLFVPTAMLELEPFFRNADTGTYTLAPESEELRAEAAEAISKAIGASVASVVFVSANRLNPLDDTLVYLRDSFWYNFQISRWARQWYNLEDSIKENISGILLEIFHDTLGIHLQDIIQKRVQQYIWYSIGDSLLFYLGFIIAGEKEIMDRLTPLVRLLPGAIPLGEKKDEPGKWLVLVG